MKVRVLLGTLVFLITVLSFGPGCGESSDQGQALEEQQRKNEELQKELDAQEEKAQAAKEAEAAEEAEAARKEEAEKQEEMQQKIDDLEKKVEEKESEPQETDQPETESDSPEVVIETAPPSQAPEGVVVVSPDYDTQAVTLEESQVLDAAIDYYQYAEIGDYYTTHSLLHPNDQDRYPVDVWVEANTALDNASNEFVVTDAYPQDIGLGYTTYAVTLAIYLPDGSSVNRTTYFTHEGNGFWAHYLTDDEVEVFDSVL